MRTTTAAGATWHEPRRGFVHTAWNARDRSHLVFYQEYQEYQDTRDKQIAIFKRRFDRAADALINLAIDELYPLDDDDQDATDDDPDEAEAAQQQ